MREIEAKSITQAVARLCREANYELGEDVIAALKRAEQTEESELGKQVLSQLLENARIASEGHLPLCQDCGTAMVFIETGQDTHVVGGDLYAAVEEGVRQGYTGGYLRKSIVRQPFSARVNTGDNTPPVIYTEITVDDAGGKACPPVIVGLGIGGTAERAMLLAKKALLRPVAEPNPDPETAELEKEILARINDLGIGPMGLGGRTTALAVQAEVMPTHIASLPVAVNLQCHSARHKEITL